MSKKRIKKNPYKDVAFICLTKQVGTELWPAVENNTNYELNYIIVCCEPSKNGVYRWNKSEALKTGRVCISNNNHKPIFCVPLDLCTYVCSLDDITNEGIKAKVIEMQNDWYDGHITNHEAGKYKKRDWYLDRS